MLDQPADSLAVGEQSGRSTRTGRLEGGGGVHAKVIGAPTSGANPWRE